MVRKAMLRLGAMLTIFALTFGIVAPAGAVQVVWTLQQFSFKSADGGGVADGSFAFDKVTGQIGWWDIQVSPGIVPFTAFRYQSGQTGHSADLTDTGTLLFWLNKGASNERRFFLFHASVALPDGAGTSVLPAGDGGEVVTGVPSKVRLFAQAEPLTGVLLSKATPADVAGGCRVGPALQSGDPVNLETGAFTYSAQLVAGTNPVQPFRFEIFYDSSSKSTGGAVGRKWSHTYELRIEGIGTARLKVVRGDGAADYFDARTVNGVTDWYATYPQTRSRLDFFAGAFIYSDTEQMQYTFDAQGRLGSIAGRSDAIGQTSGLKYGGNGRLASVTGPAPAMALATFSYDANKRLTDIYYDDGYQHVTLTYDAAGNLTSFNSPTNPALKTRFTYDADGNLLTGTTGTGPADDVRFVSNTYASGEVVSQTDAYGGVTRFEYSVNQTKVTDPNGSVSTRTFDEAGRITGAVTPDGATFSWFYDAKGNLAQVNGPRGSRTMTYDAKGRLTGTTLENGSTTGLIWGADSLLTGIVDGNGKRQTFTYDTDGNLTGFTNAVGMGTRQQLDALGRLTRHTDATGAVTTISYNAQGKIGTMTTPTGNLAFGYDAFGNPSTFTDQKGHTTGLEFDAATGVMTRYVDPMGQQTTFTNDSLGRLTKELAPDGQSVTYERGAKGEVTAAIDGTGNRHEYDYDAAGMMKSKKDPLGNITRYFYNAAARLERTVDAAGGTTKATLNAAGAMDTVTDANGNTARTEYDGLGNTTAETDPLGRRSVTAYDAAGSVSQTTNARGQAITYGWDDAGSLIATRLPGDTITYTVNPEGNRTSASHTAGTTSVVYDDTLGRVRTRTDELGNRIGYAYDAVGNLTTITYSDGKTVNYSYDAVDRMTSVRDWAGRTTTYTYDAGGSLVKAVLPDGSSVTYAHNAAGNLTALTDTTSNGATIYSGQYVYDAAGRTRSASQTLPLQPVFGSETSVITYDAANQIRAVNGAAFAYDADGNLTSGTIDGVPTTLVYDALNRLVQRNADVYRYDTDNFRITTTRGGVTTRYVWDGTSRNLRLLEEKNASGTIVARYVHGAVGLVGREDAATGVFSVYHYDQRGNTVALTNTAGVVTDRYAYDPFGKVVGRQGTTPNPFTFDGRDGVFDDGNGFYYMTSRVYVAPLGRFAQKESIYRGSIFRPATLNRYAYGEGNPIDNVDPRGEWLFAAFAAIGGLVSGVSQIVSNAVAGEPWYEGVAGAVVSGAISGAAMSLGPLGQAAAGALAAGAGNAVNQGIDLASGKRKSFDLALVGTDMAVGGVMGGVMAKLMPGPASRAGVLKSIKSRFAHDAYGLEGTLNPSRYLNGTEAAQALRKTQLVSAIKYKSNIPKLILGGPGKGLSSEQFGSTGVSGLIAAKLGKKSESCDLKPRTSIAGYLAERYLIDDDVVQVVSIAK